ncbi:hypothetical protein E2L07_18195 [Halalkalibacterium halodurans]|uniref:pLS20_p028 family conjugation system transmembrane protein n=1 Tax=Halalkalibacterium halodurans TaxID=86665 RepID=UPI001067B4F2|nr:hypothetical protein [Halalkalibacterium halodurans]TES48798.1 hypothetical protein E2L07_18195 [Halalkalibacterium halodurans]
MDVLEQYDSILNIANILSSSLRELGWWLILGLMWLVNQVEGMTDTVLTMNGFFNSAPVNNFIKQWSPVLWVLVAISLVWIGYKFMAGKMQDRERVVTNVLLAFLFIIALPLLLSNLDNITTAGVKAIGDTSAGTNAEQLIKGNIADVYLYAKKDFNVRIPEKGLVNDLPVSRITYIDINELIDPDSDDINNDYLKSKLVMDTNGNFREEPLGNGWFGIGKELYYRWHVAWWNTIFSLSVIGITLIIAVLKVGRIIFELAFKKLFGLFIAVTDLSGGQRIKQIINDIISNFAVIFFLAVSLKFYVLFSNWLSGQSSLGSFGSSLLLLAASLALIDGPHLVERILGVDAGLKDSWRTGVGLVMASKAVSNVTSKVGGKLVSESFSKFNQGVGLAGGLKAGIQATNGAKKDNGALSQSRRNQANNKIPSGQNPNAQAGQGMKGQNPNAQAGQGMKGQNPNAQAGQGMKGQNPNAQADQGMKGQNPNAQADQGMKGQNLNAQAGQGTAPVPSGESTAPISSESVQDTAPVPSGESTAPISSESVQDTAPVPSGESTAPISSESVQGTAPVPSGESTAPISSESVQGTAPVPSGESTAPISSESVQDTAPVPSGESTAPISSESVQGTAPVPSGESTAPISSESVQDTAPVPSGESTAPISSESVQGTAPVPSGESTAPNEKYQETTYDTTKETGFKTAQHPNTIWGQNRVVMKAKEEHVKGYNTGYRIGRTIRDWRKGGR